MADTKSTGIERRTFGRRESSMRGVIVAGGRAPVHCVVLNYSQGGALLELAERISAPYRFRLVIEAKGVDALCEVKHQRDLHIGVSFVGGAPSGLVEPARAPGAEVPRSDRGAGATARTSGTDLRASLFGHQNGPASEPVRAFNPEAGNIIRR